MRATARCWVVTGLLAVTAGACSLGRSGTDAAQTEPCPQAVQRPLLSQQVQDEIPTAAFTIEAGTRVYIMVAIRAPSDSGMFEAIGGAATLHVVTGTAAPNVFTDAANHRVSMDPKVNVDKARRWERLNLGPGRHRFYSIAGAPTIAVMSWPA